MYIKCQLRGISYCYINSISTFNKYFVFRFQNYKLEANIPITPHKHITFWHTKQWEQG
jgi:hypothetical protein